MKIIFCAYDRPHHFATGPNVWIKRLIPGLIDAGVEVKTLFIYSGDKKDCPTLTFFKEHKLPIEILNSHTYPYTEDQLRWILKQTRTYMPDVLVANLVIPGYFATKYVKNIPVVAVVHSNDPFYDTFFANVFSDNSPIKMDAVVTVSNLLEKRAKTEYKNGRVKKITYGSPASKFHTSYDGGILKVVYLGRIVEEQKQISKLTHSFCQIAQNTKNIVFTIYGDGEEEVVERVRSIIKSYNAGDKVIYGGALKPHEVQETAAHHHVFTLLSDYEGMPVALVEAMACGLVPVCLKEDSGINEIIKTGENGIIVEDRYKSYSNALTVLRDNPSKWKKLSEGALATIQGEFSSEVNCQRWVKFLQGLKNDNKNKKVKIPRIINLTSIPLMYYADTRKPKFRESAKKSLKSFWLQTRLTIRPRARLRKLLNR